MTWACYEWRPSWICPIWRPRREPRLAPAKNQKCMTLATSGQNLVLVERFEQFRGKYGLSPLTIYGTVLEVNYLFHEIIYFKNTPAPPAGKLMVAP